MFVSVPAEIFLVSQLLSCDGTLSLSACQNVCVSTCRDFVSEYSTYCDGTFILPECLHQYLQGFCQLVSY